MHIKKNVKHENRQLKDRAFAVFVNKHNNLSINIIFTTLHAIVCTASPSQNLFTASPLRKHKVKKNYKHKVKQSVVWLFCHAFNAIFVYDARARRKKIES